MHRSRARLTVGLLFTLIALGGCAAAGPTPPPASAGASPSAGASAGLPGTSWIVLTVGGSDTIADNRPTMAFGGDGQVQGTGGCNGYGGPYTVDGDAIEVGELASTLILCEGDVGTQEAAFMAALRGAQTWRITGEGDLELSGVSDIVAAAAGPEASGSAAAGLVGGWDLAEMGATADFAHLLPTIEFRADGTVSGFRGMQHLPRHLLERWRLAHARPPGGHQDRLPPAGECGRSGVPGSTVRGDRLDDRA